MNSSSPQIKLIASENANFCSECGKTFMYKYFYYYYRQGKSLSFVRNAASPSTRKEI